MCNLCFEIYNFFRDNRINFKNQNNFLNCVIAGLYRFDAARLFEEVKEIEKKTGRIGRDRWHPREIDIDILFFGSKKYKSRNLVIPHPQIINRKLCTRSSFGNNA